MLTFLRSILKPQMSHWTSIDDCRRMQTSVEKSLDECRRVQRSRQTNVDEYRLVQTGSRTIGPEENWPPTLILALTLNQTLNGGATFLVGHCLDTMQTNVDKCKQIKKTFFDINGEFPKQMLFNMHQISSLKAQLNEEMHFTL